MHYFKLRNLPDAVRGFKLPIVLLLLVCSHLNIYAQNVLSTAATLSVNNGSGGISFNVYAKNDVKITEIQNVFAEFNQNYTVWFAKDSIQGAPFISANMGWQAIQSGTVVGDGVNPKAITLNTPIIVRAGETFGFYIEGNTRFMTASVLPFVFYDDNLSINTGEDVGYGGALSPTTADRQFVGKIVYDIITKVPEDAGATRLENAVFCAGSQALTARVRNFGSTQLNSLQINWSVNGTTQTPVSHNALIDTFGGSSSYTASIGLGNYTFATGQTYTLKVWTSSPNGTTDGELSNDSFTIEIGTAFTGNYTIGGSNPDFATLEQAITALHTNGVCGATSFLVRNGTYIEQMNFETIKGVSATNTVEFVGESKTGVLVRHSGISGNPATVYLKGTKYLTIKNMTISSLGTGNSVGIQFMNRASYNVIDDNIILLDTSGTTPSSTSSAITASSSLTGVTGTGNNAFNNTIKNNLVYGGYYGIRWNGTSSSDFNEGNQFINNQVSHYYYYGIYLIYQSGALLEKNTVSSGNNSYSYSYNIYLSNTTDMTVNANRVPVIGSYGMYITAMNKGYSTTSTISNNIIGRNSISTGTTYGMYCSGVFNTRIVHNTVLTNSGYPIYIPSSSTTASGNLTVNNNIFVNGSGVALYTASAGAFASLDYNLYYTQGASLLTLVSSYANLNAARTAHPTLNVHSLSGAPNFVGSNDFHLTYQSSPAGTYQGIDVDFDGDSRCTLFPTIGADESTFPVSAPAAGYGLPDTLWQSSAANILNNMSSADIASHKWYLNGNLISTSLNLAHDFPDTGHLELKLVTVNCGGIDSFTSVVYVSEPLTPPTAAFSASLLDPEIYIDEVQFFDNSTRGASTRKWLITPFEYFDASFPGFFPTYAWNSGDEFSLNPKAVFTKSGEYTICLIASNSKGSDTLCKTNYITVKEAVSICNTPTISTLTGVLYDDGGYFSNYSSSLDCDILIQPCASEVTLNLLDFDLKTSDVLRIYDGTDSLGIPLWNRASYPNGMTGLLSNASVVKTPMVAKSGRVFIQFVTNASTVGTGFRLEWSSVPLAANPLNAQFFAADTLCQGNPSLFENTTSGQGLSYVWLVDGVLEGTQRNLTHEFTTVGQHLVQLVVENCSGVDTLTKTVLVVTPTAAPVPVIEVSKTLVNLSETVTLFDSTSYCISLRQWSITPSTFVFINGTTENSRNPQIRFTDTGCYSISLFVENSIGTANLTENCLVRVINYCEPSVTNLTSEIGIGRVQLANLDHSSTIGVSAYSDFTSISPANLVAGSTTPITVSKNSETNLVSRAVWIDLDRNGIFETTELLASSVNSNAKDWTSTVQIPATTALGITRMRIGSNFGSLALTACGQAAFGEFEDYSVNIVADFQAPILVLNGNDTVWVEQGFAYTEQGATATDNVDGNISSLVAISGSVDNQTVGQYGLTYSISDQAGNAAIPVQRLVIVTPDVTAPVLTLVGANPYYLHVNSSFMEEGYTAIDQLDGDITDSVKITGTIDTAVLGDYTLVYTVSDKNGNSTTVSRTVVVYDSVAPVVTLTGSDSIYLEVFNPYTELGSQITDNNDVNPSTTISGVVNTNRIGTYILNYCGMDVSGNQSCIQRKVVVGDTTRPVITLLGNNPDTVWRWQNYAEPGVDVSDNYDPLAAVGRTGDAATHNVGTFTLTYVAIDQSGNVSDTVRREVIVVEKLLGVENLALTGLQIYPNPSEDVFHIEFELEAEDMQISVLNLLGKEIKEVHSGPIQGQEGLAFSMKGYAPGVYFVQVVSAGERGVYKIVLR